MSKMFEEFRRELADAVTVAINQGVVICDRATVVDGGCCPLGVRAFGRTFPSPATASHDWGIAWWHAREFMLGFDGFDDLPGREGTGRFFELGRLYRQRFVGRS